MAHVNSVCATLVAHATLHFTGTAKQASCTVGCSAVCRLFPVVESLGLWMLGSVAAVVSQRYQQ